MLYMHIRRIGA